MWFVALPPNNLSIFFDSYVIICQWVGYTLYYIPEFKTYLCVKLC